MTKKLKQRLACWLVLVLACCLMGVSLQAQAQDVTPLQVQFVPTSNDPSVDERMELLADYLNKALGHQIKVTKATDYSTIVQEMEQSLVDIGIMPPAAYVQARRLGVADAVLTAKLPAYDLETGQAVPNQTSDSFKAAVIVKADSSIQSLEDLVGKRVITLHPVSASGYIYPVAELADKGIDVSELDFTIANDVPEMIQAVLDGEQDAFFSFQGTRAVFDAAFADHDLFEELRVIYLSEGDIPNDAIALQPTMNEELKQQIIDAFKALPETEEGRQIMSLWGHVGYTDTDEAIYDSVEAYIEAAGRVTPTAQ